jgi:hypothetical protein
MTVASFVTHMKRRSPRYGLVGTLTKWRFG